MLPFLAFRAPYTLSNQSGPDDQRSSHIESMEKPLRWVRRTTVFPHPTSYQSPPVSRPSSHASPSSWSFVSCENCFKIFSVIEPIHRQSCREHGPDLDPLELGGLFAGPFKLDKYDSSLTSKQVIRITSSSLAAISPRQPPTSARPIDTIVLDICFKVTCDTSSQRDFPWRAGILWPTRGLCT